MEPVRRVQGDFTEKVQYPWLLEYYSFLLPEKITLRPAHDY